MQVGTDEDDLAAVLADDKVETFGVWDFVTTDVDKGLTDSLVKPEKPEKPESPEKPLTPEPLYPEIPLNPEMPL